MDPSRRIPRAPAGSSRAALWPRRVGRGRACGRSRVAARGRSRARSRRSRARCRRAARARARARGVRRAGPRSDRPCCGRGRSCRGVPPAETSRYGMNSAVDARDGSPQPSSSGRRRRRDQRDLDAPLDQGANEIVDVPFETAVAMERKHRARQDARLACSAGQFPVERSRFAPRPRPRRTRVPLAAAPLRRASAAASRRCRSRRTSSASPSGEDESRPVDAGLDDVARAAGVHRGDRDAERARLRSARG